MIDPGFSLPLTPAPQFRVYTIEEAMTLAFLSAGMWLHQVRGIQGTPVGHGCRREGPHGPVPCGSNRTEPGGPECDCGCSAFEDYCDVYTQWYDETYKAKAS